MKTAEKFFGWYVVGGLCVIYTINSGFTYYGGAVINAQMANDLKLERSLLGLGLTCVLLVQAFSAPLIAWVINRLGSRLTIAYGSCVLALGAALLGFWATQPWHYVAFYGFIIGAGNAFSSFLPVQTCVALWFEKKRATALSIVLSTAGIGGLVLAPMLTKIIAAADGNWRVGWYVAAASALLSGTVSLFLVKNCPQDHGQLPDGQTAAESAGGIGAGGHAAKRTSIYRSTVAWNTKDAVKTSAMWLMVAASIGFAVPFVVILSHLIPHLKDIGNAPGVAAMAIGALGLCSIIGKLGAGFLCDRFEPRYVWVVAMQLVAASIFVTVDAHSTVEIYLIGILLGLGYGAASICWASMVANYFGAASFASVMGLQLPLNGLAVGTAPFLVGLAYDAQGSYTTAFYAIAAFCLATGWLLMAAAPPTPALSSASAQ